MFYYPKNILFFTVCVVAITTSIAINVQNMNDFQKSRFAREFPGENVLNGESKQQQPHTLDEEILGRIEVQLMGAMEMLQNYKAASSTPAKYTEKRKNNKFEFIRFGR
uniref:FMRFamide-like peptide 12 n=1 Tax=Meloidogyne minor TaxID=235213 RepID=Q2Q3Z1_9BILA|nr:FMRFamide-like peptide 12 [Meloidogyne minor]